MFGLFKKKKEFVVGSPRFVYVEGLKKETKTCDRCGAIIYFSDNWDWKKYIPICQDCVVKIGGKREYKLQKKTIENVRLHTGKSKKEIINAQKRFVKRLEKKGQ